MASGTTNFGGKFYISPSVQNSDLDLAGFQAISGWIELPNVSTIGPTGIDQNVVTYPTWGNKTVQKGKGQADAGSPDVECLDVASAGKDAFVAAGAVDNGDNYAFAIEWEDGSIEYNRGLVMGPVKPKGGNEDFKRLTFTLGLQQPPVENNAATSL